jgi:hypothetical protein
MINNAGSAAGGVIEHLTEDDWEKGLQLKFMGYVRCLRYALPIMVKQGGGRVVRMRIAVLRSVRERGAHVVGHGGKSDPRSNVQALAVVVARSSVARRSRARAAVLEGLVHAAPTNQKKIAFFQTVPTSSS